MILYHGSDKIVKQPLYGFGKEDNDYGSGFYLCEDVEKANAWAVANGKDNAYCSKYDLPIEDMNVLSLDEYGTLSWVAEVIAHRGLSDEDNQYSAQKFVEKYKIDTDGYDVITGYRADDSYMNIIDAYFKGQLNILEVDRFFRKGELGEQVCIKSQKAFDAIRFVKSTEVKNKKKYLGYDAQARREVMQFLDNRRRAIQVEGFKPYGPTIDEVLHQDYSYEPNLKYYFPTSVLKPDKSASKDHTPELYER